MTCASWPITISGQRVPAMVMLKSWTWQWDFYWGYPVGEGFSNVLHRGHTNKTTRMSCITSSSRNHLLIFLFLFLSRGAQSSLGHLAHGVAPIKIIALPLPAPQHIALPWLAHWPEIVISQVTCVPLLLRSPHKSQPTNKRHLCRQLLAIPSINYIRCITCNKRLTGPRYMAI